MDPKLQKIYEQLAAGELRGDIFQDEAVARGYDQIISQMFGTCQEQYNADLDFLLDLTTYKPTDFVVDLGCGTGISTLKLLERKPGKILGIDFSEPMLNQAREKLKGNNHVEFRVASAEELSSRISNIDKVVGANVFQYLLHPEKVLQGVYKVLNPDGDFLFNVKLKTTAEQSIYASFFHIVERALNEVYKKRISFPELKGLEPKYTQTDLETLAARTGFSLARYEEKPIIYDEKTLRVIQQQLVEGMKTGLEKAIDQEATTRIVQRVQEDLTAFLSSGGSVFGKEAYLCWRKVEHRNHSNPPQQTL